jgi:cytochrome c oxidase subunit 3
MSVRDASVDHVAGVARAADGAARQRVYVTGMAIALCGLLLFFASLGSAWVVRKGLAGAPEMPLDLPGRLLGANTFILLFSSAMIEKARRRLAAQNENGFRASWYAAIGVGCVFLLGQVIAWREVVASGILVASSPDASFYYLLTAAHGVQSIGGIAGLMAVAWWPLHRVTLATAAKVAAMYWHFLTVIWTCIFLLMSVSGG